MSAATVGCGGGSLLDGGAFLLPALLLGLAILAFPVSAAEPAVRPSARLLAQSPDVFSPGRCVRYAESGDGLWAPAYYLEGEVIDQRIVRRTAGPCPLMPGKTIAQYSRDEFNRLVLASPCVAPEQAGRDTQIGVVRLRVSAWETPHAKKAENAGRLYRGMFVDRKLEKDMEIEFEADLLGQCSP